MAGCSIDYAACKGCALCVAACPVKIIVIDEHRLNARGYAPARLTDEDKCIGCAACAVMCPECAITVVR
jgi:2-oxoglutarate ferredoxin oxidoreductase subunit delta